MPQYIISRFHAPLSQHPQTRVMTITPLALAADGRSPRTYSSWRKILNQKSSFRWDCVGLILDPQSRTMIGKRYKNTPVTVNGHYQTAIPALRRGKSATKRRSAEVSTISLEPPPIEISVHEVAEIVAANTSSPTKSAYDVLYQKPMIFSILPAVVFASAHARKWTSCIGPLMQGIDTIFIRLRYRDALTCTQVRLLASNSRPRSVPCATYDRTHPPARTNEPIRRLVRRKRSRLPSTVAVDGDSTRSSEVFRDLPTSGFLSFIFSKLITMNDRKRPYAQRPPLDECFQQVSL